MFSAKKKRNTETCIFFLERTFKNNANNENFKTTSSPPFRSSIGHPEEAESATVTLSTGAFPVFSAGIDRSYPCVELPALTGDFILTVTFDNGDEYEGEIR